MSTLRIMINFILSILLNGISISAVAQSEHTTIMKQSVPIDTSQLRHFDSKFVHHVQAFSALETDQNQFKISEVYHSTKGWNLSKPIS